MSNLYPAQRERDNGIRRLSRLTWRATQLSAIAAVAFATLFARAAGANSASGKVQPKPAAHASPYPVTTTAGKKPVARRPAPKRSHRARRAHHRATATPAPAPSAAPPPAPAPAPSLTPPPAPPTPAPSPSQTTSSGSHGGG